MAFKYDAMGQLVASNPKAAAAKLAAVFKRCGYVHGKVAAALSVDRKTLLRWRSRLVAAGCDDPSGGRQGVAGRPQKVA